MEESKHGEMMSMLQAAGEIMAVRQRYLEAFIASTGMKPEEAMLIQFSHADRNKDGKPGVATFIHVIKRIDVGEYMEMLEKASCLPADDRYRDTQKIVLNLMLRQGMPCEILEAATKNLDFL